MNETVSKDRATALIVLVLGLTVLLISACQSGETAAVAGINEVTLAPSFQNATQATPSAAFQVGPVSDYPTLVDALRAAGANVELDGEISQPFFPLPGQLITVEGGEVQSLSSRASLLQRGKRRWFPQTAVLWAPVRCPEWQPLTFSRRENCWCCT